MKKIMIFFSEKNPTFIQKTQKFYLFEKLKYFSRILWQIWKKIMIKKHQIQKRPDSAK